MNIQIVPQVRAGRRDADKRVVIVPLIAFAMVSATLAFVPSRPVRGAADAGFTFAPAGLPLRGAAAVPMPQRLRLPSYRRPPLPTFSAFAAGLARETPPSVAARVAREFMKEPRLADAWNQFSQNPEAPAQEFVGQIASLPEFRRLMSRFAGEPGFREAFYQLARKPEIDGVLKAALLPAARIGRAASGAGGMSGRTIHGAARGGGYGGVSTGRTGLSEALGSGVPHALAPVPAVGEWREAAPAGGAEARLPAADAPAIGARPGDGLGLDATPRPLSSSSGPADVKTVERAAAATTAATTTISRAPEPRASNVAMSILIGAGTGALTGALIGSVVPGVGTAAGAVIGGLVGGAIGGVGAALGWF